MQLFLYFRFTENFTVFSLTTTFPFTKEGGIYGISRTLKTITLSCSVDIATSGLPSPPFLNNEPFYIQPHYAQTVEFYHNGAPLPLIPIANVLPNEILNRRMATGAFPITFRPQWCIGLGTSLVSPPDGFKSGASMNRAAYHSGLVCSLPSSVCVQ